MSVWVAGTGAISCLGQGVDTLWDAAVSGRSGIRDGLGWIPETALKIDAPANRAKELALLTLAQAMCDAGWSDLNSDDGLILATTTGQIPVWDKALTNYLQESLSKEDFVQAFSHQPLGDLLQSVARAIGFSGRQTLLGSACSASTQALALAAMWLEQGWVNRCVVGGVEVLCDLTIKGFSSLQLLSHEPSRPFDISRSGINISEGAAFVCLERKRPEKARVQLSGFGISSDGHHMTAPNPEGKGCFNAMSAALRVAEIEPGDVSWVHAHGTGSHHNDLAEAAALRALFPGSMPWVSSTKQVHGHALGASGIIESVLCIEALTHQTILKTHGLEQPDPKLNLRHPQRNEKTSLRHILKNTLGFGGTNAALVWSGVDT